ncbi:tetratricopeptide repeat protein [Desulfovibrio mangrovi]|uniref:tetratricopeptide repeat protein n=1 Tax=Desulfovibrio mangrovi TaxID=2976983 RepID=UPI002245DF2C|nr:tetratricopeptide repeat protein [Desulfovibrio mangrovi]UZP68055.1 tetratricopeptide repeat protein [Desulfovibrio mangrovi]
MSEKRETEHQVDAANIGIVGELQHGISEEAQPLLKFLVNNFRAILIGLGAILVVIGGYGIYDYSTKKALASARMELGDILINKDGADQVSTLEAFIAKAPEKLRPAALFELARLSLEKKDYDKAAGAWASLAGMTDGEMGFVARLGKAQALAASGKMEEAFSELETAESVAPDAFKNITKLQFAVVAEQAGKLDRALAAYEALQGEGNNTDKELFAHKISQLKARLGSKG